MNDGVTPVPYEPYSKHTADLRQFTMAARAEAGARFSPGQSAQLTINKNGRPYHLRICTRYLDQGAGTPLPEDLWLEIVGESTSVPDAGTEFFNVADDLITILALLTNASVGAIKPEIIFESAPGLKRREFFQTFLPNRVVNTPTKRLIDAGRTLSVLAEIENHPDLERLMRAMAQYRLALHHCAPETELLALAHLFMAAEALKKAALRTHLRRAGLVDTELGQQWGFDPERRQTLDSFLQEKARVELVFQGKEEIHRAAKQASDGFEHGFTRYDHLHEKASKAIDQTFRLIRSSILDVCGLTDEIEAFWRQDPYDTPRNTGRLVRYVWATIECDSDEICHSSQAYPTFIWRSKIDKAEYDEQSDSYKLTHNEVFEPLIGPTAKMTDIRAEFWDGSTLRTLKLGSDALRVADSATDVGRT
jgi:hypothetical protein